MATSTAGSHEIVLDPRSRGRRRGHSPCLPWRLRSRSWCAPVLALRGGLDLGDAGLEVGDGQSRGGAGRVADQPVRDLVAFGVAPRSRDDPHPQRPGIEVAGEAHVHRQVGGRRDLGAVRGGDHMHAGLGPTPNRSPTARRGSDTPPAPSPSTTTDAIDTWICPLVLCILRFPRAISLPRPRANVVGENSDTERRVGSLCQECANRGGADPVTLPARASSQSPRQGRQCHRGEPARRSVDRRWRSRVERVGRRVEAPGHGRVHQAGLRDRRRRPPPPPARRLESPLLRGRGDPHRVTTGRRNLGRRGLRNGPSRIQVRTNGGSAALNVVNHPISGPVFSGPHLPLLCTFPVAPLSGLPSILRVCDPDPLNQP